MFKPRTIALAGSIAALSFAAVPVAQAATTHHAPARSARVDASRDAQGVKHVDRTPDRSGVDNSRDVADR